MLWLQAGKPRPKHEQQQMQQRSARKSITGPDLLSVGNSMMCIF